MRWSGNELLQVVRLKVCNVFAPDLCYVASGCNKLSGSRSMGHHTVYPSGVGVCDYRFALFRPVAAEVHLMFVQHLNETLLIHHH